jgi:hypothetical protein
MRRSNIDYAAWDRIGRVLQKRFGRVFKNAADDEDETDDPELGDNGDDDVVSRTADRLVETGGFPSRAAASDYLFHSPHGAAVLQRARAAARKSADTGKDFQMTRDETLASIAKRHGGVTGLCKHIAFSLLKGYKDREGHCDVLNNYKVNGFSLGS